VICIYSTLLFILHIVCIRGNLTVLHTTASALSILFFFSFYALIIIIRCVVKC
jgi:hypothetical protein